MKTSIIFLTTSGNTEELADVLKEAAEDKGMETYISEVTAADKDEFLSGDILCFGSPAQGEEEVAEDVMDFVSDIGDSLSGKKVFMFGSYGWGGGEYMEAWTEIMTGYGAILIHDPVTCLEAPDEEVIETLKTVF